ncbi:S8 family serine peptidase [Halomonas denitrificans]|nr:S8 family serine peptidase [Halomonas denitrificans]
MSSSRPARSPRLSIPPSIALSILLLAAAVTGPLSAAETAWRIDAEQTVSRSALEQATWTRDYGAYRWLVFDNETGRLPDDVNGERVDSPYRVGLHGARFDPTDLAPGSGSRTAAGQGLTIVQLRGPALPSDLEELDRAGLDIFQPLPGLAYLAWATPAGRQAADQLPFVRAAVDLPTTLKTQPSLKARGEWVRNVNVHFYNSGAISRVLDELGRQAGVRVLDAWPAQPDRRLYNAVIEAPAATLAALAAIPEVVALSYLSPEPELEDESAAQVLADNLDASNIPFPGYPAWLGSVGLDGSGVTWATTDTGVWYAHGDYNSRIVGGINYPGCSEANPGDDPTSGGHGTHVTGIWAGDGTAGFVDGDGFLYGHGMAPGASIFAQNPICGSQNSWPPAGGWQVMSRDALLGGAVGSNNSWTSGEGTQHGYQATERTYDLMVLDGNFDTPSVLEPFMVVFSAGNSGGSGVTAPKEAKNVVVTGGTQTFRVSGDVDAIYGSSSRGPAVDNRWLPTIAAPGQSVSSTRRANASQCATAIANTNGEYSFCTGTSMAAPHASGALVLLTEWWRNQFAVDPSPAMGKALLINSAVPVGPTPPPNNDSGWGRIDLSTLVDDGLSFEFWDQTQVFSASGESFVRTVGVVDPGRPVKITLVWSDAPGAVGANPAMVNDLDLTVVSGGQTYLGNNFSGGFSQPGGSADRLNNIEQVTLAAPGGSATITVDAFNIAGSVLLDQPGVTTAQHFALVCQNCLEQPDFTMALDPAELTACVPDSQDVVVTIDGLLGFDDPVTLNTSGLPGGVTGSFDTNPVVPSGVSTLTVAFGGGSAPGTTTAAVEGTSTTGTKSLPLVLNTFDAVPAAPGLVSPGDGAVNTLPVQTFEWTAVAQGLDYRLEVATDPGFSNVVHDVTTRDTSVELALDSSTFYYWRVTVDNACGSAVSTTYSFNTQPEPGDCPIGSATLEVWSDDMESGANGWTMGSGSIQNTWQQSGANVHGGAFAWNAENLATISDQRLVSPPIALPGSDRLPLTLRFWNHQELEDASGACWDAAVLEISTDGGASWTDLNGSAILHRAHDGTVNDFSGGPNPLAGMDAWCGDPRAWDDYVIDLSAYADETIQLRFRVGTDGTVGGRAGWTIDDLRVEACEVVTEEIFIDGFETP